MNTVQFGGIGNPWFALRCERSSQAFSFAKVVMMAISRLCCAMLLMALAHGANAQSRGALAARSQATARISVRVAPRFVVRPDSQGDAGVDVPDATPRLGSNAPSLRYTLARQVGVRGQAGPSGVSSAAPASAALWLIIPD